MRMSSVGLGRFRANVIEVFGEGAQGFGGSWAVNVIGGFPGLGV